MDVWINLERKEVECRAQTVGSGTCQLGDLEEQTEKVWIYWTQKWCWWGNALMEVDGIRLRFRLRTWCDGDGEDMKCFVLSQEDAQFMNKCRRKSRGQLLNQVYLEKWPLKLCVCVCWQTKPGNGTVLANPLAVLRGESLGLSQSSSTGGGTGVETVFVDTSPMIDKASFVAWYIRRVSSRRCASWADSSINEFCIQYYHDIQSTAT